MQGVVQHIGKAVLFVIFTRVQVQMQDGVFRPVLFLFLYGKPFEEFPLPAEVGFERRNQQTFSEPAWAAQEVIAACVSQLIDQFGLVHIDVSAKTDFLKTLYSDRIFHTTQLCFVTKLGKFLGSATTL